MLNKPNAVKTQVDRWPLTQSTKTDYLVTVIIVAHFDAKPSIEEIINVLKTHAAEQVKNAS